ncbi:hypothetical protein [Halalkaliarchaeum sp. AArc-CO]|uniref:hypothetical protein n=1 Tax=Halalkaliarchaeum sp. AArc-CO TaxID=2866381 RepID=UPI00217E1096|nr:hypothetical protein [Halalkaliarchaeum sp. AArc-CO]
MSPLTRVSVAFAVLGILFLVAGTGGFSAMTADRGVDVSVVPDDEAYVGIETVGDELSEEDRIHLLTITNQFASGMDELDVTVADGNDVIDADTVELESTAIGVGEGTAATAECTAVERTGVVELDIEGGAGGASFEITRTVEVDCGPTTGTETVTLENVSTVDGDEGDLTVEFKGTGNVFVSGDPGNYTVTVTYKKGQGEPTSTEKEIEIPENQKVSLRDGGGQIIKVTIGDRTVSNPVWGSNG